MFFFDIKSIAKDYDSFKEKNINKSKIFKNSDLIEILKKYRNKKIFSIETAGYSVKYRKIFKIKCGYGKIKIFFWSQMHGDETTGTKSIIDILNFFLEKKNNKLIKLFFDNFTIFFIPMLNPDGSEYFQRRNAMNIDLNRDSIKLISPEINILFKEIKKENPNILFNLHDQKRIYNVDNKKFNPAIISFLSPLSLSICKNKIYNSKIKSMGIIYEITKEIKKIIPSICSVGRYSNKYYPNATGDFLQKKGYSYILIEAGNYPKDTNKNFVRKYHTLSIIISLYLISCKNNIEKNYKLYSYIRKNKKILLDKIYRNVKIKTNGTISSLEIGFKNFEKFNYKKKIIEYELKIVDIGDLSNFFSYEEIIKEKILNFFPKIGDIESDII
ncbi:M14 family zinc carboxypeptidase [Blattabacterium cuenoti]|uniref:M14 family zinc carboxypeptidase n=1 Tax=Blattabacterium cuenoti TaxID=1653831 RepID=UPI00163C930A|nr:M14 family zinc carboxypeptidase [Blattabacterium cuenoti]